MEDPECRRRSEREAKLLASLNHPNIAAIYDLEESDGIRCLILEFVEGRTLAERLKRGSTGLNEALEISRQITEALEAAHEQGIVHRDLKPGNVMISATGIVKVLDFGIAKMVAVSADGTSPSTIDSAGAGMLLGTATYMSPEQARGKFIDKRTDIWAFGCVLFELLTGRAAFQGETVTDILAAVVERDPDWQAIPAATPPKIQDLLRRCLQKDVRQRLRDIGDARIQIEEALRKPLTARTADERYPSSRDLGGDRRWALPTIGIAAIIAALMGWVIVREPQKTAAVSQLKMGIQPAAQLGRAGQRWLRPTLTIMAFSPDGQTMVFSAMGQKGTQLFTRRLDQSEATPIPGTEGGAGPFFSPDGKWVGFWAEGKIHKISVDGGPRISICPVPAPGWGATWAEDDTIYFSFFPQGAIFKVTAAGGQPELLIPADSTAGEQMVLPQAVRGRKVLLLTVQIV